MPYPFSFPTKTYPLFLAVLLLLAACASDDAPLTPIGEEYISIPDEHFETRLIEQGIDSDGSVNEKIRKADAAAVTRLELDFSANLGSIQDMTGLEGFTNLTFLSVTRQDLADIDLSANTRLDTLLLIGNALTQLDISNNPDLVLLNAQSNLLRSVSGLANATSLKRLDLSFNDLEALTLNNPVLEAVLLSNNLLTAFDPRGAGQLQSALLTSNRLTAVDFSQNPLLETLVLSDNSIQQIDLQPLGQLTYFYMSSNQLTELDVSNNPNLVDLRVDRNPDLTCIQIQAGQDIPSVSLSDYQELKLNCD
jgi:Leucine-rich repeat (LRR) protein